MDTHLISHQDVCSSLGIEDRAWVGHVDAVAYENVSGPERDACVKRCVEQLTSDPLPQAGTHRHPAWETGWMEHETLFDAYGEGGLTPRYFYKYPYARIQGSFVRGVEPLLELSLLRLVQDVVGDAFLSEAQCLVEYGCGTGHNLVYARKTYAAGARLIGMDWARSSQRLVNKVSTHAGLDIEGQYFDYFDHRTFVNIPRGSAVLTVCSLEQVGTRYVDFIEYLIKQRPSVVVHIEPMQELLDSDVLLDWLSIQYAERRNYLKGFLSYLNSPSVQGRLEVLLAGRSGVGSFFVDGYQVCAWTPR